MMMMMMITYRSIVLIVFAIISSCCFHHVSAFAPTVSSPPLLGIGAVFFRPKGMQTRPSRGDETVLVEAAHFFTDAFWSSKVGGGTARLSDRQRKSLNSSQTMEFRRRYGLRMAPQQDRRNELLVSRNGRGEIMGVLGIEVDRIPEGRVGGSSTRVHAPLMSNVAVGRKFRRRGVAEELVSAAEDLVRKQWGYNECYLYVEKRNTPAINLYRKLGYRKIWEDDTARTLIPTKGGGMKNDPTTLVCMRKTLTPGLFGMMQPF